MEKYKRFTDMSISIPDHVDHYHHRNKKDVKMTTETADTSIKSHDSNHQYENQSKQDNLILK